MLDLRTEWLPEAIYGEQDYTERIVELSRRRYYSRDAADKAGILRYTKVVNDLYDLRDIPAPTNERELAWLLSFYWEVDQAYNSLSDLFLHRGEGSRPEAPVVTQLERMYQAGVTQGLNLTGEGWKALQDLGIDVRS